MIPLFPLSSLSQSVGSQLTFSLSSSSFFFFFFFSSLYLTLFSVCGYEEVEQLNKMTRKTQRASRSIYILGLIDKKTKRLPNTFNRPMYLGVNIVISSKKQHVWQHHKIDNKKTKKGPTNEVKSNTNFNQMCQQQIIEENTKKISNVFFSSHIPLVATK